MSNPPPRSRQIRVFISSTFRDMQADRDVLVKNISYARHDQPKAERIRRALLEHDFGVWFDSDSLEASEDDFATAIQRAIDDAVSRGFVLVLLSPASLASRWSKHETEYALQLAARSQRSNVIPVVIAPFSREALPVQLASLQWFDLTKGQFDERVEELIRSLKTREME